MSPELTPVTIVRLAFLHIQSGPGPLEAILYRTAEIRCDYAAGG